MHHIYISRLFLDCHSPKWFWSNLAEQSLVYLPLNICKIAPPSLFFCFWTSRYFILWVPTIGRTSFELFTKNWSLLGLALSIQLVQFACIVDFLTMFLIASKQICKCRKLLLYFFQKGVPQNLQCDFKTPSYHATNSAVDMSPYYLFRSVCFVFIHYCVVSRFFQLETFRMQNQKPI